MKARTAAREGEGLPPGDGQVRLALDGPVASVVFDRPEAHNAMTWSMYAQLAEVCERLQDDPRVRVATFRGAGGKAFVAGTDIAQFRDFTSGDDGVAYERRIEATIERLERLPMPTIALIEGWAVGGGLALAAACDLRLATRDARFGIPIARTLGNCLSITNMARLTAVLDVPRIKRMLLLAQMLDAQECRAAGFVADVVEPGDLDAAAAALCDRVAGLAPLTLRAAKEGLRRIVASGALQGDDLVRACYGSDDFREGVAAFTQKRPPVWSGR